MGWYLLADARYHALQVIQPTEEQLTAPVDSVLAVDPGLSVPIIHLLEFQLMTGDSAGYERWLDRYRLAGGADVEDWERIPGIRWSPPDSFPDRFGRAFSSFQLDRPLFSTWPHWVTVPLMDPEHDPATAVELLDDLDPARRPGTPPATLLQVRLNTLLATGRVQEAVRLAYDSSRPAPAHSMRGRACCAAKTRSEPRRRWIGAYARWAMSRRPWVRRVVWRSVSPSTWRVPTLARAWEAAGDTERAAHYYAELLRLWHDADPELQSQVEDARRALRRLTEER